MPNIETIAIILGILIVVTRFPIVIWPKQFLSFLKHKVSNESFVRMMGIISFLSGLVFIYFIWNEISLIQLLVGGFSLAMLIIGSMVFIIPKLPSTIFKTFESNLTLLRTLAFLAVLVGLLLIRLGY